MKLKESVIALIIPGFDFGGEEKRVLFFANNYVNYFKKVFLFSPEGKSRAFLDSRVEHITLSLSNPLNIYKFVKYVNAENIDFVQGHKRATMPYLLLCENLTKAKCIFNFDNIYLKYNWLAKFFTPKYVVYLSDVLKTFYSSYYGNRINTTINMGGDFLSKMSADEIAEIKNKFGIKEQFIILSLGRLSEQKNHLLLLNALAKAQSIDFLCLVAGTGKLEADLKKSTEDLGLTDKVQFLGHRTDVRELLNISDVLIQTSIFEGFPNVFIEAASVGVPIIATNVGSSKSIIWENGILIESKDEKALINALNRMVEQHSLYKEAATNLAQSKKLLGFTKEAMLSSYISYYETI